MGQNTDALADCDKAVEIEPDYAGAHMGRGNALLRLDRPADALDSYRLAAQADPSSARAHIAAGKIHESQGRPADALDSYRRAAVADPSNVVAHMAAGEINEGLDSLPESMAGYNAAAGIAGAEELAGGAQARVLKRQGRLRDEGDMIRHIKVSRWGQHDDGEE